MVFFNNNLGGGVFLFGLDRNRCSVCIGATYEYDLLAELPEESYEDVGGDVCSKMSDVARPVNVRQTAGYQNGFFFWELKSL